MLVFGVSLGLATLAASMSAQGSNIWQMTVINDDDPATSITMHLTGVAGFLQSSFLAVSPSTATITFSGTVLNASWPDPIVGSSAPFIADFLLPSETVPGLFFGNWLPGGVYGNPVNPDTTSFVIIPAWPNTPEPSTLILACLAAAGFAVLSLRRRRNCRPERQHLRDHY
jgi:hypothetical protein